LDKQDLLNILLWLPFFGSIAIWFLPKLKIYKDRNNGYEYLLTRHFTLVILFFQLLLALCFFIPFKSEIVNLQYQTKITWIESWGVSYHIGLEGINLILILLTTIIFPIVAIFSYAQIKTNIRAFNSMLLLIQFAVLGALLAQDLFLFYCFWEAMLIPAMIFIVLWGGNDKLNAFYKFLLYTAFGSILMLGGIIYLAYQNYQLYNFVSFAYSDVLNLQLPITNQLWLFAGFVIAFAIKLPLFPFHSWQPITYNQSPILATIIFSAVLSKVGGYGLIKLAFGFFDQAARILTPLLIFLAVFGIIYGALIAYRQKNIKTLLAFSSISHLGFILLGLTSFTFYGYQGAIVHMFSHGLIICGLFLMISMLVIRFEKYDIDSFSGIAKKLPTFSVFFVLFSLAAIGLPTTSGFVGEFYILLGSVINAYMIMINQASVVYLVMVILAVSAVILSAVYMLKLCQNILFGELKIPETDNSNISIKLYEKASISILIILIFMVGLYPKIILDKTDAIAKNLIIASQMKKDQ